MDRKQGLKKSNITMGQNSMLNFIDKNQNIQTQMEVLVHTFKQYSEQNKKLTGLYELVKFKNQELSRLNCKFSQDICFLKDYCSSLENQLSQLGYYKHQHGDMLSRKQTAEGIFITYSSSTPTLNEDLQFQDVHQQLRNRILNLQNENRLLKQQLQTQKHLILTKSLKVSTIQNQKPDLWRRSYQASEERVKQLEIQIKTLRKINDSLEFQRQKKGINNYIMKDREKLFNNIHNLISQYKKKINDLASEKKEVEKKYKQLKQKVSRLDQNSQFKLIQLYSQKIQVLQKLTEKQQIQIENTIQLYDVQLQKIEERRRQEIEVFQDEKLDLQTQNLKLCIDLQKSLNNKDEATSQLMQEKRKNEILLQQIIQLREAIQSYKKRQNQRKNLSVNKNNVIICINPDRFSSNLRNINPSPCSSFISKGNSEISKSNSQNSNTDNIQYQISEISDKDKKQLIQRIEQISLKRQNSISKKSIRDKIKITYGNPHQQYMLKPYYGHNDKSNNFISPKTIPSSPSPNVNKSYDSVIQYKKRFIQRKPQSSYNL